MAIIKKTLSRNRIHYVTTVVVVLAIVITGVHLLANSHAESPYISTTAESGTLTSPATVQSCTGSSDGKCVQFGIAPLAIHVKGTQLLNGAGNAIRLLGVDASDTEQACVFQNSVGGADPINSTEAAAIASWKINAVRIPLNEDCWLGINNFSVDGESGAAGAALYQAGIENWVHALNSEGIITILDLHWAAPGTNLSNQQWPMADEDHAPAFWTSLATTFKADPAVIFDLFNEPYLGNTGATTSTTSAWTCWLNGCSTTFTGTINGVENASTTFTTAGMQQLVNTVRATGATQPILLGGLSYSGDPCGMYNKFGSSATCTETANLPTDPLNQLIVGYHNYFGFCSAATCWNTTLQAMNAANIPMVTDEFGEYDCADGQMSSYMNWADQNNESYLAWSWVVPNILTQACIVNDQNNFPLISNWDGTPSTQTPQGSNYQTHLAAVSPY